MEKDKIKYVLNPFTGQFDAVSTFNENRIITHMNNSAGNPLVIFDPASGTYLEMGSLVVTDEEGNVIVK